MGQLAPAVLPNSLETVQQTPSENDNLSIDEFITFFDSCVLSRDKNAVLEQMKSSAELRMHSNQNNREIFDKCFHLYRVDMDLVNVYFN